ncbi:MAG: hypothetical protein ACLRIT_07845 [Blautia sp.]
MRLRSTAMMEAGDVPEFELLQSISTLATKKEDGEVSPNAASRTCLFAPDGRHLFCTTAGENTVGMFEVNSETGLLERRCCPSSER